ncbi:hypothetical protein RGQ29_014899 [Quercus rubra]|uniref:Uncharacterized protein n=1 Tax=Quercus rubra TaxID=3512 RepID=A0AAN7FNI6_QUERU|nr:hypothetical protein RGQ29_014899 [Quercus rubra]
MAEEESEEDSSELIYDLPEFFMMKWEELMGYKPTDDDLLEMEVRRMAHAKAKAKGLPCPLEPLKPYTSTLNGKFVKTRDSQHYWSPYEARTSDEDEEGGEAPSDSDEGNNSKSDSSSDSSSSDDGDSEDDSNSDSESDNSEGYDSQYSDNDWGEPPSDRKDEDVGPFYEDYFNDNIDYYDKNVKDDAKAEPIDMENGTESEEYELENVLEAVVDEAEEANNIDYDDYPYGRPSN